MLSHLKFIPDAVLFALGRCSRQEHLAALLASQRTPTHNLRQQAQGRLYHVQVGSYGMDLSMQCVNPDAAEDLRLWGLHGVTLHTAVSNPVQYWRGPWPEGLDIATAQVRDVVDWLAPDDEAARLSPPTMACVLTAGVDGHPWSILCTFDATHRTLRTFSVMRAEEEWVMASTLPPWPEPAAAHAILRPSVGEAITCRSNAAVPRTGLWEARLPTRHPMARRCSEGEWRFAYRKFGDTMSSLGVADEHLVVWTWVREGR